MNWDGVFDLQGKKIGLDGVVHDYASVVHTFVCSHLLILTKPIVTEVMALGEHYSFVTKWDLHIFAQKVTVLMLYEFQMELTYIVEKSHPL